ncbi:MAG TPA: hypothetical protein ENJ82_12560 [Bacteroidetes bacterium]|nr:hypothetical protein [Bacteroidota bacterium]
MQHNWIFQLAAPLQAAQRRQILPQLEELMTSWKAHGAPVPGQVEIRHDHFIIVQATPGATSGCSIDSMTHSVEEILAAAKVELRPHSHVFYRDTEGVICAMDFREAGTAIGKGQIGPESTIFDASLGQSNDLNQFEVRLVDSWLSRYLPAKSEA